MFPNGLVPSREQLQLRRESLLYYLLLPLPFPSPSSSSSSTSTPSPLSSSLVLTQSLNTKWSVKTVKSLNNTKKGPSAFCLRRKTHLLRIIFLLGGHGQRDHVPLVVKAPNSASMATSHSGCLEAWL
jgi:hypothetical protein